MNDFQTQAQALANEVLKALDIECLPLVPQHERHDILRYHMYAHNFRYSGVFCRIVVTIYAEKPLKLTFCASGRNPMNGYDEVDMADNAQDLLAMIPETITRAKDVERQKCHEMQHRLYSNLMRGGTSQDLPVIGGNS